MEQCDLHKLAAQFLLEMKKGQAGEGPRGQLAKVPAESLHQLYSEEGKKAFWINCYNAFFLWLRKSQGEEKPAIFREHLCPIAGQHFSLDEIEHGILRRFRAKLSGGYLPNLCMPLHIRKLAVKQVDFRIHFALNCGAKSCPPIAFYEPTRIEEQLEIATLSFLEQETQFDSAANELHFSRLDLWYIADFGGRPGIRKVAQKYLKLGKKDSKVVFNAYSWDENLDNFAEY